MEKECIRLPDDEDFFESIGDALRWYADSDVVDRQVLPTTATFLVYWLLSVENSPEVHLSQQRSVKVRDGDVTIVRRYHDSELRNSYSFNVPDLNVIDTIAYIYDKIQSQPNIEGWGTLEAISTFSRTNERLTNALRRMELRVAGTIRKLYGDNSITAMSTNDHIGTLTPLYVGKSVVSRRHWFVNTLLDISSITPMISEEYCGLFIVEGKVERIKEPSFDIITIVCIAIPLSVYYDIGTSRYSRLRSDFYSKTT